MRLFVIIALLFCVGVSGQVVPTDSLRKDSVSTEQKLLRNIEKYNAPKKIKHFNPTEAGLYSAVLPGFGQYYNRKYWKIPIVWGAIGTGVGIAVWNQKQYRRYRNAFIAELNHQTHEFSGISGVDAEVLGNIQDRAKRQRDYAIAITAGIYILNIVDAIVDAHLYAQRHDSDLAIAPVVINNQWEANGAKAGLSLNFRF